VLAARFATPQRALTCALYGRALEGLRRDLQGRRRELHTLEAMSDSGAYAIYLAPPVRATLLPDDALRVALRIALCAPVLRPTSLRCRPLHGSAQPEAPCPGTRCTTHREIQQAARLTPWLADQHARTCKRGGGPIVLHDTVRSQLARALQDLGLPVAQESHDYLLDSGMRADLLVRAAGPGRELMSVDITRRDGAALRDLQRAEEEKERKYREAYNGLTNVFVCGFAFDEHGRLGPRAHQVIELWVAAAARATGGHPDDLRREILSAFGFALNSGLAAMYARAAMLNDDQSDGAPNWRALMRSGTRRPNWRGAAACNMHGVDG
jgi:hypothetical protein